MGSNLSASSASTSSSSSVTNPFHGNDFIIDTILYDIAHGKGKRDELIARLVTILGEPRALKLVSFVSRT